MSKNETVELSDFELDQLLSYASHPIPAADFKNRLFEKFENFVLPSNVIAFPRARKTSLWLAGVPLAGSRMVNSPLPVSGNLSGSRGTMRPWSICTSTVT